MRSFYTYRTYNPSDERDVQKAHDGCVDELLRFVQTKRLRSFRIQHYKDEPLTTKVGVYYKMDVDDAISPARLRFVRILGRGDRKGNQ